MKLEKCLQKTATIVINIILVPYFCFVCLGSCFQCCCGRGLEFCGTGAMRQAQRKIRAKEIKKWQKERKKNEPKPLPRRRRSLSTLPSHDSHKLQQSRLLRLPLEVRRQILVEVLGKGLLHLVQLPKRLGHIRCEERLNLSAEIYASNPFYDISRECWHDEPSQFHHDEEPPNPSQTSDGCLAILRVCHQIYSEAADILYTTNTFDVNHPQTLIFLARTIRPQRLEAIRCLQIGWTGSIIPYMITNSKVDAGRYPDDQATWENMWNIVGTQMKGLRHLNLRLESTKALDEYRDPGCETRMAGFFEMMLLAPRSKVRGLDTFQLEIPGGLCDVELMETEMRSVVCNT